MTSFIIALALLALFAPSLAFSLAVLGAVSLLPWWGQLVALAYFLYRLRFWYREGQKLKETGYLTPKASLFARLLFRDLSRLMVFLSVGPVRAIGLEKLRNYRGRLMVVGNHQFQFDFVVFAKHLSLLSHWRHLGAANEASGPRAIFAAFCSIFTVAFRNEGTKESPRYKTINPEKAIEAGARSLNEDDNSRVLIYPQGRLIFDNVISPEQWRSGAAKMMSMAWADDSHRPLALLPVAIVYDRDRNHADWVQKLMYALGQKWFRRIFGGPATMGATIIFGDPIPMSSLPSDVEEAAAVQYAKVQELLERLKTT